MKWIKIFESFKSQKEIEHLANEIVNLISHNTYDMYKTLWDKNGEISEKKSKLFNLVGVRNVLSAVDKEKFKELKPFINNFNLDINLNKENKIEKRNKTLGSFNGYSFSIGEIILYYDNSLTKKLINRRNNWIKDGYKFTESNIYNSLFTHFYDVIIHELQHAYDHWRSKGKFLKTKRNYKYLKDIKKDEFKNLEYKEKLSEKELEKLKRISTKYLKLRYEIDARFTETIRKVSFFDLDFVDDGDDLKMVRTINPFEKILKEFKRKFEGFSVLTSKQKKRVLRKLGQFWELSKDEIKVKENEINESLISDEWVLSIKFNRQNLERIYWENYYPLAKRDIKWEEAPDKTDNILLEWDDWIYSVLNKLQKDIRLYLNKEWSLFITSKQKGMKNLLININDLVIKFPTNIKPGVKIIKDVNNWLFKNLKKYFNNINKVKNIKWEFYINDNKVGSNSIKNIKEEEFSSMSQKEIQKIIDDALDEKDFDTVKKVSKYLKENKIFKWKKRF